MTCEQLQNHVLGLEVPARPESADARQHLRACPSCRDWQRQLVQLEQAVPLLVIPPAEAARSELMRRILAGGEAAKPQAEKQPRRSVAMILGSLILDPHASPRRRVGAGLVAGLAAAAILFVAGWLVWLTGQTENPALAGGTQRKAPVDTLVADVTNHGLKLAEDGTPRERVEAMAGAADTLFDESRAVARKERDDDIDDLAQLYGRVVRDGLLPRAKSLPPEDRRDVLAPIANRLSEARSEALALRQTEGLEEGARAALDQIAAAAAEGSEQLRSLYGEKRS
jgi:hypothetical protein